MTAPLDASCFCDRKDATKRQEPLALPVLSTTDLNRITPFLAACVPFLHKRC